jgi:hypothetical protein
MEGCLKHPFCKLLLYTCCCLIAAIRSTKTFSQPYKALYIYCYPWKLSCVVNLLKLRDKILAQACMMNAINVQYEQYNPILVQGGSI